MSIETIRRVFSEVRGKWQGCDWHTQFGRTRLNLEGIRAAQAVLMARATGGIEAADWRAAAEWLAEVERAARDAEEEAEHALSLASSGDTEEAFKFASRACAVESIYHKSPTWQLFREALQAELAEADDRRTNGDGQRGK